MGLALVQDQTKKDTFRWVGLVRWVKKSIFTGVKPSMITLI
jgi:hypothetical protein